ncbi:MAG: hypothetical protein JNJ80_14010 [Gemmatimonadetes bacterium]|nr:hypothetical protein [Gemmatimonadota bacterium]
MRSRTLLLLLLVASPAAAVAQRPPETITAWGSFNFKPEHGQTSGSVAGPADSVFQVLRAHLIELGTKGKDDPTQRQFAAARQRVVGRWGKVPVSRYLSCGSGLTGPNADAWHVYYTLVVGVARTGPTQSSVELTFTAEAVDVPNGQRDRVACATTGAFELALIARLREVFPGST